MPPKADSTEIAIQNALAAMDADPTLKGTDAAKQYNAIYQRLMARRRVVLHPPQEAATTKSSRNPKTMQCRITLRCYTTLVRLPTLRPWF
jgi:hypothetical protein